MKIGGPKGPNIPVPANKSESSQRADKKSPSQFDSVLSDSVRGNSAQNASQAHSSEVLKQQALSEQKTISGDSTNALRSVSKADISQIADRIRSGEITPLQGAENLVSQIVSKRTAALPPATTKLLRDTIARMLTEDPLLSGHVRDIGRAAKHEDR